MLAFEAPATGMAQSSEPVDQSNLDDSNQQAKDISPKSKPKIKKYPNALVWNNAETASIDFPESKFIGEYRKGSKTLQVTTTERRFYISVYEGGLPGDGWDGTSIAHDWFESDGIEDYLTGWTKVDRSAGVVGKKPPADAIVLFDGMNTEAWANAKIADGYMKAGAKTKQHFQDFQLYFEFLVPLKPELPISHPHRGNSGVFALGAYEIQIADTFGLDPDPKAWRDRPMLKPVDTWCGSVYGIRAAEINMCLPPLTWQSMEIEFKAARFKDGEKVTPAVISLLHNGVKVLDNVSLPRGTGGGPAGPRPEVAEGPILLQNHGNPNLFRNIWITPLRSPPQ
ncbi:large multi-functional protein [Rhodopirellula maiorica SM1]|uniref:Large multi-functional protein n=1 Tax=Rhodopirellula maiorica SM1 TaxID=1265738 RepID=M5R8E7_9BACT|nr:large multi-functional protein [Rhodopirellula maiorica SM1]